MDLFYINKKESFEVNLGYGRLYLRFGFPGSVLCMWLYLKPFWGIQYSSRLWVFDNQLRLAFLFLAFEWIDWTKGSKTTDIKRQEFNWDISYLRRSP